MDHLADRRSDERHADDDAAVLVDHHPGTAGIAVGVELGPGDPPDLVVDRAHAEAAAARLLLSAADGGNLGIGEDHLGDGAFVGGVGVRRPRAAAVGSRSRARR